VGSLPETSDYAAHGRAPSGLTVTNTGQRLGADVPQLSLTDAAGDRRRRFLGFEWIELEPGESPQVTLTTTAALMREERPPASARAPWSHRRDGSNGTKDLRRERRLA
jgi:hypothetical protein